VSAVRETHDWALVARLLHRFNTEFDEPISPVEVLAQRLAGLPDLRALVIGDPPHGFVALRFRDSMYDDAPECHLAEFYVAPDRRARGEGTALLQAALELARDAGATHIELNTDPDDHAAHHVYERAGFKRTAHYYEREL
jgi:GNAT superfamily N-acetyltransferase